MKKQLTTIPERRERFRTVKERFMYFPEEIDVNKLALKGYVCGERTDTTTGLNLEHFDCVSYLTCSENQRTKEPFIQALGHRKRENRDTVLILSIKN
tara:strand:+ start:124 stop:414 length:291 start_codon:yes stop_codon:yes gene_type:complete